MLTEIKNTKTSSQGNYSHFLKLTKTKPEI